MKSKLFNEQVIVNYARWIIKKRLLVLFGVICVGIFLISGIRFLKFDNHYRKFFSEQNPFLQAYESLEKIYAKNDGILIVLGKKDDAVFTRPFVEIVHEITKEAWQTPYSYRVDSLTNFQHILAESDDLVVRDLLSRNTEYSVQQLAELKAIALNEPLLKNRLISDDALITAINISVRTPEDKPAAISEIAEFARELRSQYQLKYPDLQIYLTGQAMMNAVMPEISEQDMSTLLPIMFGLIILFSWLFLRSVSATLSTLLIIGMSTMTGMGLAGWFGISLSPVSASVPIIILMLAVADSIHLLMTLTQRMRDGLSKYEAIVDSVRVNFLPVFITSITTVIGFLGLNFSDAPPFRDLGNITAMGVTAAFIYSMTLLPVTMAILPIRVKKADQSKRKVMDGLSNWIINKRNRLLWVISVISIAAMILIPGLKVNDSFLDYVAKGVSFRDDSDYIIKNLTGFYTMEFSLDSGVSGGINNPEYFKHIDAFTKWLKLQSGVVHVDALSSTIKRLNKAMNGGDEAWYRLPQSPDAIAQYLLLYELSLPLGLDLNNQINVDKSASRMIVTLGNISTSEIKDLKLRSEVWLKENTPEPLHAEAASSTLMFTYIASSNAMGLLIGTAMSLGLISITLMLLFKSIRFGLISMVPNILPVLLAFGIWRLIDGEVGVAAATVATVTIGIVVDDTVHFLTKYKRAREIHKKSSVESVRFMFSTVGMALLATTVILCAGFAVLSQSLFKMNYQLGVLTAITIVVALLLDFLFLPGLLIAVDKTESEKEAKRSIQPSIQTSLNTNQKEVS